MPSHSLAAGTEVIDGIVRLGQALGYKAVGEHPVEEGRRNPAAVDVAWLSEEGQRFPLMIFEVESRASNAAANNPVKVFGQSLESFEKPLFYFHVFLNVGPDTARADNLVRLFGTHNYRVYRLDREGPPPLLRDVLAHHRRLSRSLRLPELIAELDRCPWNGTSPAPVLRLAESLSFDAPFLAAYARRAVSDTRYRTEHLRLLVQADSLYGPEGQVAHYGTFLGSQWSAPVHLGLLSVADPHLHRLEELREWQERSGYMSRIGPHLGLSRDYDEFVLGLAPVLWALTAALMYKVPGAATYILSQLATVLDRLGRAHIEVSFFSALWMLHIAGAVADGAHYEQARAFLNARGGVSADILYNPPGMISVLEADEDWKAAISIDRSPVPDMRRFYRELPPYFSRIVHLEDDLNRTAYEALTSEKTLYDWEGPVALLLHTAYGRLPLRRVEVEGIAERSGTGSAAAQPDPPERPADVK